MIYKLFITIAVQETFDEKLPLNRLHKFKRLHNTAENRLKSTTL